MASGSHEMVDMTKRHVPPVPEQSTQLPPEQDVGHPMHMTLFEDRIIRVVRTNLSCQLTYHFFNLCNKGKMSMEAVEVSYRRKISTIKFNVILKGIPEFFRMII